MARFKIVWEIELEAESPLEAAKEAQRWTRHDDWQYYVQNTTSNEIFSVDLQEEDEDAVIPVEKYEPIIEQK